MLGIKRNRKPAAQPQVITKVVYREGVDQALVSRTEGAMKAIRTEYAQLSQYIHRELDKRDAGKSYDQKRVDLAIGAQNAIAGIYTLLSDKDPIVVTFRLDKQAEERRDEEFPNVSKLSHLPTR